MGFLATGFLVNFFTAFFLLGFLATGFLDDFFTAFFLLGFLATCFLDDFFIDFFEVIFLVAFFLETALTAFFLASFLVNFFTTFFLTIFLVGFFFNADGQEVEHCGNGARCIGLYIQQQQLLNTSPIRLKTKQNILPISSDNDIISVNMGQPNLTAEAVHYTQRTTGFAQTLTVDQHTLSFYLVSVGNPHAIVIEPPPYDVDLDQLGTLFNQHTYFPEGINLSIARIEDPENIALQVYERGVGQTQACGTAACAVMAVGRHLKQLASTVRVHQPGGTLIITWQGDGTDLMMRGEACHVFEGQWP